MKLTRLLPAFALLAVACLPSCGTVHSTRWVYGMPSCFDETTSESESVGLRAVVGAPVILGGVVFDVVTWPGQLVFGVWPMWGPSSQHMKPENLK